MQPGSRPLSLLVNERASVSRLPAATLGLIMSRNGQDTSTVRCKHEKKVDMRRSKVDWEGTAVDLVQPEVRWYVPL